jgi:orotidine-5'-phosphate decarboxylase
MTERRPLELGAKPIDRLVLAVDTSDIEAAERLMGGFRDAGGSIVKLGTGLASAKGAGGSEGLSALAEKHDLAWIYDGKVHDIGNTMRDTIGNVVGYDHPPVAITMHAANTSLAGMKLAQETAGNIPILGVTLLTDISPKEAVNAHGDYAEKAFLNSSTIQPRQDVVDRIIERAGEKIRVRVVLELGRTLGSLGVQGLVASARELVALRDDPVTRPMLKLIPGTRSLDADANDQQNVMTPEDAIADGADLLVIGREYLSADNRAAKLIELQDAVAAGLHRRKNSAIHKALATDTLSS